MNKVILFVAGCTVGIIGTVVAACAAGKLYPQLLEQKSSTHSSQEKPLPDLDKPENCFAG